MIFPRCLWNHWNASLIIECEHRFPVVGVNNSSQTFTFGEEYDAFFKILNLSSFFVCLFTMCWSSSIPCRHKCEAWSGKEIQIDGLLYCGWKAERFHGSAVVCRYDEFLEMEKWQHLPKRVQFEKSEGAYQTDKGKVAGKVPFKYTIEKGKKYSWCSCGFSHTQVLLAAWLID